MRTTALAVGTTSGRYSRLPVTLLLVHVAGGKAAHAEQAGARVRGQHGADLADDRRRPAVHLAAALDQLLERIRRVDVLRAPGIGARVLALTRVVDHALHRAAARPDALDRRHLVLDREDRLDLQRRADPGAGSADPAAALEELERVDHEPELQVGTRGADVLGNLCGALPLSRRVG